METLKNILINTLKVSAVVGLVTLVIKLLVEFVLGIWNAPIDLSILALNVINFLLNGLLIVLFPLGTVLFGLYLVKKIREYLDALFRGLFQELNRIKEAIVTQINSPKGVNIAPMLIAGISGLLVYVVKENAIPGDVKLLLLLALGTVSTTLSMATSQTRKNRRFGYVSLVLSILIVIGFLILRFNVGAPGQFQATVNAMKGWFLGLAPEQYASMVIFVLFSSLMVASAIIYRKEPTS